MNWLRSSAKLFGPCAPDRHPNIEEKNMRPFTRTGNRALAGSAAFLIVASCIIVDAKDDGSSKTTVSKTTSAADDGIARATIEAKSGTDVSGFATFKQERGGVLIDLTIENASPGWHAVHIHEIGDCSSDDGKSAGGHFNPTGHDHGSPHLPEHHAGDLGNMEVGEDGRGRHVILMPALSISGEENGVRGRAIIVHAGTDDLVSQPTGAAGGRIGCGVIR